MTLPTHLLWMDLETTGLDPQKHRIAEVAACLVPFTAPFATANQTWIERVVGIQDWSGADRAAAEMHAKSGLIGESVLSSETIYMVDMALINMLAGLQAKSVVLAGSSVHFDLGFVREHMKGLATLLHHRIYDVSAVRNFAYSLGMPEDEKSDPPHRAKADLLRSIELGRRLTGWFREKYGDERELELRKKIAFPLEVTS